MPTIPQIITYGKIAQPLVSNDIKKKGLFGGGIDLELPRKLYCIRQNIEFEYNIEGVISETTSEGQIILTATGNNGSNLTAKITDPILGLITLGSYTKVGGDTNTTILATNIAAALNINTYGYAVSSLANSVNITCRNGLGATLNGNNLSVTATTHAETQAKAFFTPTRVSIGMVFNIHVVDPTLGDIVVGSYTQQSSDTTDTIFIANLAASVNVDGYTGITSGNNGMYVVAAPGLGATINGNASLIVWSGGFNTAGFSGGINGFGLIPNTITQFSGGVTAVNPSLGLVGAANYYYALCGAYGIRAQYLVNASGYIAPITPPSVNLPPIEFIVSNTSPIVNGGNTLSIPQYKGYNIIFNRNGLPQSQINVGDGSSYFAWNPVTAILQVFGNAVTSELFSINPTI